MRLVKLAGSVVFPVGLFGGVLFLSAWTLAWWRAWVFVGTVAALALMTTLGALASQPELLDERYRAPVQPGQPLADKVITPLIGLTFVGFVAFVPRDVFHYAWLGRPSPTVSALGLVLFAVGWSVIALALRANAFAAPIVKHQGERGQTVVQRGPYRVVRHPMYAGALLVFVGMPLWLGSYGGTVAALVPMAPLVARTLVEERTLRRSLPGYADYAQRVRWHLVPGVW